MKSVPVASAPPELVARIANDAVARFGLSAPPHPIAAWWIYNPYSKVLCIELAQRGWNRRFFAKLPRRALPPASPMPGLMQKEFELLQLLCSSPGPQIRGTGTVEPLAFYPDVPSLVTIGAVGRPLRKEYSMHARLAASRQTRTVLVQRAALCGRWLQEFHRRTDAGYDSFNSEELLAYCRVRLDRLHATHPAMLVSKEAHALLEAASQLAQTLRPGSLRLSGRHNDFASHNIIACPDGGIRVLDFMAYDVGGNAFDVCNFWFDLEMLKNDPTYSSSLLARMQKTFLEAYGDVCIEQPDFRLAQLRYAVNRLLNELSRSSRWRLTSPRWHLTIRAIRRWLHDFARHAG